MTLRQLRVDEFESWEWVEFQEFGNESPVYIKTYKKADIPPLPDTEYLYKLVETTKLGDTERQYKWVPVLTSSE